MGSTVLIVDHHVPFGQPRGGRWRVGFSCDRPAGIAEVSCRALALLTLMRCQ